MPHFEPSTTPLKPSLVEWKQVGYRLACAASQQALKPSLVEWKRASRLQHRGLEFSLKPSLVEWKLSHIYLPNFSGSPLETFLSGMETTFHMFFKQINKNP